MNNDPGLNGFQLILAHANENRESFTRTGDIENLIAAERGYTQILNNERKMQEENIIDYGVYLKRSYLYIFMEKFNKAENDIKTAETIFNKLKIKQLKQTPITPEEKEIKEVQIQKVKSKKSKSKKAKAKKLPTREISEEEIAAKEAKKAADEEIRLDKLVVDHTRTEISFLEAKGLLYFGQAEHFEKKEKYDKAFENYTKTIPFLNEIIEKIRLITVHKSKRVSLIVEGRRYEFIDKLKAVSTSKLKAQLKIKNPLLQAEQSFFEEIVLTCTQNILADFYDYTGKQLTTELEIGPLEYDLQIVKTEGFTKNLNFYLERGKAHLEICKIEKTRLEKNLKRFKKLGNKNENEKIKKEKEELETRIEEKQNELYKLKEQAKLDFNFVTKQFELNEVKSTQTYFDAYYHWAKLHYVVGEPPYDLALNTLLVLVQRDFANKDKYSHLMGQIISKKTKNLEKRNKDLSKLLQLDYADIPNRYQLAKNFFEMEKYEEAKENLDILLAIINSSDENQKDTRNLIGFVDKILKSGEKEPDKDVSELVSLGSEVTGAYALRGMLNILRNSEDNKKQILSDFERVIELYKARKKERDGIDYYMLHIAEIGFEFYEEKKYLTSIKGFKQRNDKKPEGERYQVSIEGVVQKYFNYAKIEDEKMQNFLNDKYVKIKKEREEKNMEREKIYQTKMKKLQESGLHLEINQLTNERAKEKADSESSFSHHDMMNI